MIWQVVDYAIARRIVDLHSRLAESIERVYSQEDILRYITFARQFKPKVGTVSNMLPLFISHDTWIYPGLLVVDLGWGSGTVMDCHTTAWSSIPGGNDVKTELHVLRNGQWMGFPSLNDLTVYGT